MIYEKRTLLGQPEDQAKLKLGLGGTLKSNQLRRRRKLKYAVVDDDWGLGDGEDRKRMEDEEHAKSSFLMDGRTDC